MKTKNNKEGIVNSLQDEIESQRAILQTYLASDMDIDEMDYEKVIEFGLEEIGLDDIKEFLGHWKDYAFLRGKQEGSQSKEKEMLDDEIRFLNWCIGENNFNEMMKEICLRRKRLSEKQKLKGTD